MIANACTKLSVACHVIEGRSQKRKAQENSDSYIDCGSFYGIHQGAEMTAQHSVYNNDTFCLLSPDCEPGDGILTKPWAAVSDMRR